MKKGIGNSNGIGGGIVGNKTNALRKTPPPSSGVDTIKKKKPFSSPYQDFMEQHRWSKSNDPEVPDSPITNNRIGTEKGIEGPDKIWGGKYSIPESEYQNFLQLYYDDIIRNHKLEYLTEVQFQDGGPILVDFDFHFSGETMRRQYRQEHVQAIIDCYLEALGECYQLVDPVDDGLDEDEDEEPEPEEEEEDNNEPEEEAKSEVSSLTEDAPTKIPTAPFPSAVGASGLLATGKHAKAKRVFDFFVFEKPDINRMYAETKHLVKDGLHFLIAVYADALTKELVREKVLQKLPAILGEHSRFGDLGLTNNLDSVVDDAVCKGSAGWNLYGSRKPRHDAYELTQWYEVHIDKQAAKFTRGERKILGDLSMPKDMMRISARNRTNPQLWFRDDFTAERVERIAQKEESMAVASNNIQMMSMGGAGLAGGNGGSGLKGMGLVRPGSIQSVSEARILAIRSMEELQALTDVFLDNLDKVVDYEIQEAYDYVMVLPPSYYEKGSHMKRIKVCWALRHISDALLIIWIRFVYQRQDKDFSRMAEWVDIWTKTNVHVPVPVTKGSIRHWARHDNPSEYEKVRIQTIDYHIEQSIRKVTLDNLDVGGDSDANKAKGDDDYGKAFVLYQLFKDEYVCVSPKNGIWYHYYDHYWHEIEGGASLRLAISQRLRDMYVQKAQRVKAQLTKIDPDHENYKMLKKRANMILEMANKMGQTTHKKHIMQEAADLFWDPLFMEKLDTQPYLLCCKNGVMDFKEGKFRRGYPEDYLSKCTNLSYIPFTPRFPVSYGIGDWRGKPTEEQLRRQMEIREFMEQLFPIPELCEYMWQHLASMMIGDISLTQTLHLYVGKGRNGKSTLVDGLLAAVLGSYKVDLPVSFYTTERTKQGSASPEVMKLMGARLACSPEPSKGESMIEGPMKQLTSGIDMMQGRALYKDLVSFRPQCHAVICANNTPIIKATDEGTWRRIRKVPFLSLFTERPMSGDPFHPYQFKVQDKFDQKIEQWKEVFLAMLIEKAYETGGKVQPCEIVVQASKEYRAKQDVISEFVADQIVPDKESKITKTEIQQCFSTWYRGAYGHGGPAMTEVHEALDRMFGDYNRAIKGWRGVRIAMEKPFPANHPLENEEGGDEDSMDSLAAKSDTNHPQPPSYSSPPPPDLAAVAEDSSVVTVPENLPVAAKKRIIRRKA
jgi:P4 family phage/plasmid primase-like protien